MKNSKFLLLILCSFIFSDCTNRTTKNLNSNQTSTLDELYELMQGSFDSSEQAAKDSSFYNISLHMYPIWQADLTAKWLYVEQALYSKQEKPYRQRIYKLTENENGIIESAVYKLENEENYIGQWQNPKIFDIQTKETLQLREGCAVFLRNSGNGVYTGATKDKTCKSTLRGASYASSVVTVEKDKISSWDQGFDDQGNQVWGAVKSGYIFIKSN